MGGGVGAGEELSDGLSVSRYLNRQLRHCLLIFFVKIVLFIVIIPEKTLSI